MITNFNEFVRTNQAIAMQKKSKDVVTLKEMGDAMKAMPQYQEMLNKVLKKNKSRKIILRISKAKIIMTRT